MDESQQIISSDTATSTPVFAIVCGEASGDILGAGLIRELRKHYPEATFTGIGGSEMLAEGFKSLFPMERLSVMGLVEVLSRIRELFKIRNKLLKLFTTHKPLAFIGIDAPDFNLGLELKLRQHGITTIHYVSPSVWAWRQKRIFKIRKAVDHMLAFLPFEVDFYKKHNVPVTYTGHPLADTIPLDIDTEKAKNRLNYNTADTVIGLLPGSRVQEVKQLAPLFLKTITLMVAKKPNLKFIIPCVNEGLLHQIQSILQTFKEINVRLTIGNSHQVMAASDALLLASGTAALEGMLYKKPMIVSYKLSKLTWIIAKRLVKSPWCSLPNILAKKTLIPEILQENATPERLSAEMLKLLENSEKNDQLKKTFLHFHQLLKQNADVRAASAVINLIKHKASQL